jgi:hypothetical protein
MTRPRPRSADGTGSRQRPWSRTSTRRFPVRLSVFDGVGDKFVDRVLDGGDVPLGYRDAGQPCAEPVAEVGQHAQVGGHVHGESRRWGHPLGGEQRDVVAVAGHPHEHLQGLVADPLDRGGLVTGKGPVGGGVGTGPGQFHGALGDRAAGSLQDAVGVQQQQVAGVEMVGADGDCAVLGGVHAERAGTGGGQVPGLAVPGYQQRWRVAGRAVGQVAGVGVEHDDADGGGARGAEPARHPVGVRDGGADVPGGGQPFAEHRAELAHGRGGGHAVPDDVTHDQRDPTVH